MPTKLAGTTFYSVSEVAHKLNVTTMSVRNYLRHGQLPTHSLPFLTRFQPEKIMVFSTCNHIGFVLKILQHFQKVGGSHFFLLIKKNG